VYLYNYAIRSHKAVGPGPDRGRRQVVKELAHPTWLALKLFKAAKRDPCTNELINQATDSLLTTWHTCSVAQDTSMAAQFQFDGLAFRNLPSVGRILLARLDFALPLV
jgi:hypothetical protein